MADLSAIKLPNGTTYNIKDSTARSNSGVTGVKGSAESSYRTGQVNLTAANVGAVAKSGDTMTGKLTLKADQYTDAYSSGALDLKNSNIDGVNSIYTADSSENAQEGIHFYRDSTHVDSIYAKNGILYFTPNRQLGTNGIPQEVYSIPQFQRGTTDISIRPLISRARANRLAFLPPNQVIIEKTTDGGITWTDAGYTDAQKIGLFATSGSIVIPLLNNAKSELCGLRVTITGMRYDVPNGTSEVNKYSYWNSEHILSQERYFNVREWWFWLSSNNDTIQCEIQAATGANSTNWRNIFNSEFHMTGWSGSDWIRAGSGATFGGGTTQTGNYWNWRLIFWSRKADNKDTFQSATAQSINIIQCYGDSVWGTPNSLMSNDHLYSYDNSQNATFPAKVTATSFSGNLTGNVTGNVSGSAGSVAWTGVTGKPSSTGNSTTGISIAAHGTGTVIGVQSTTTAASKVTVGSHSTDYGVKSAGSASTWTFEEKSIPNITSAGTASSWTFEEKSIPNVTAAGSGSASLTFTMDTTDTKKLKIAFSHTHTAPTIGTAIKVQSKSGGSNGTAPTLGTAIKVQSKSGGANSTAPTLGSKVPTISADDVPVPIKNASASTFVTGTTHTITDNGHTHSI